MSSMGRQRAERYLVSSRSRKASVARTKQARESWEEMQPKKTGRGRVKQQVVKLGA